MGKGVLGQKWKHVSGSALAHTGAVGILTRFRFQVRSLAAHSINVRLRIVIRLRIFVKGVNPCCGPLPSTARDQKRSFRFFEMTRTGAFNFENYNLFYLVRSVATVIILLENAVTILTLRCTSYVRFCLKLQSG